MKLIILTAVLLALSLPMETVCDQPVLSSGTSGIRTTGETAEDPHIIPGIPFVVTDNTCAYRNDYSEELPCTDLQHAAPDIVFALTPMFDQIVIIDLHDAGFATRVYLYENNVIPGGYARRNDTDRSSRRTDTNSMIEQAFLSAGSTYYFIVDGCGNTCGEFTLRIREQEARSVRSSPWGSVKDETICLPDSPGAIRLSFPG